ncbi:hypothetical protein SVAN01_10887 [Stagonosporopsis vannaccii]|nr:hypothetical protein SVAN01_10887 [Stagonosporopsis vannaccii]
MSLSKLPLKITDQTTQYFACTASCVEAARARALAVSGAGTFQHSFLYKAKSSICIHHRPRLRKQPLAAPRRYNKLREPLRLQMMLITSTLEVLMGMNPKIVLGDCLYPMLLTSNLAQVPTIARMLPDNGAKVGIIRSTKSLIISARIDFDLTCTYVDRTEKRYQRKHALHVKISWCVALLDRVDASTGVKGNRWRDARGDPQWSPGWPTRIVPDYTASPRPRQDQTSAVLRDTSRVR